jgi:hypothetical protein
VHRFCAPSSCVWSLVSGYQLDDIKSGYDLLHRYAMNIRKCPQTSNPRGSWFRCPQAQTPVFEAQATPHVRTWRAVSRGSVPTPVPMLHDTHSACILYVSLNVSAGSTCIGRCLLALGQRPFFRVVLDGAFLLKHSMQDRLRYTFELLQRGIDAANSKYSPPCFNRPYPSTLRVL